MKQDGGKQRRNVFIMSSSEAKPIARAVKRHFDAEADVDVWDEDIFQLNRSYLETLINRASYYDFAIAVFASDDESTIRKKRVRVTRNNVIFEFGLFMGRLGIERSFLLLEEGVAQFSDWSGIETTRFRRSDNLMSAVGSACDRIRNEMLTAEKLQHFTMLPSTSLAIGYYNNFLKRVFDAFEISDFYTVVERDEKGQIVREDRCRITDRRPLIHVKLPRRLRDLESDQLKEKTSLYRQIAVTTRFREFPFYIGNESDTDTNLTLFDIPTTMLSSKIAIEKIFSAQFLARDNILERLENREIINFERTLRIMVPDKLEHKYFKFSILE